MPQGRKWKMGYPNMYMAPGWSQISKTDTGALELNDPTRTCLVGKPPTMRHHVPDRMIPQGIKLKTGFLNVHKAPGWSQLSKTDMGTLERNNLTRSFPVGLSHKA